MGTQTLAATFFRSTFYHKDTGAGKGHFGVLLLSYWVGDLPTHPLISTSPGSPHAKQTCVQLLFLPLTVSPWASYLPSRNLSFVICQTPS